MNKGIKKICVTISIIVFTTITSAQLPQQFLTPTPPLGWNSWYQFGDKVSEDVIKRIADALVSTGLRDVGYNYVVIDDAWQYGRETRPEKPGFVYRLGRDKDGRLMVDPEKFPSGMKALADYVHARGLKFGIYTAPGVSTCYGCTGSLGSEETDIKTFVEWGVDFLKLDLCNATEAPEVILERWRTLIDKYKRPIVLSVNMSHKFHITSKYANMWRTTQDIQPVWRYKPEEMRVMEDIYGVINEQTHLQGYQKPGRFNDPDLMQIGMGKLTLEQNEAHLGMWAIFGSPLILGCDFDKTAPEIINLLKNREVLAINQDPAGVMGTKISEGPTGVQVWTKRMWKEGEMAVAFLNSTDEPQEQTVNLSDLGIRGQAFFRDAIKQKDIGLFSDKLTVNLAPTSILLAKVIAFEPIKAPAAYKLPVINFKNNKAIRLEAENAKFLVGRVVKTDVEGASGNSYVIGEYHRWGRFLCQWHVNLPIATKYKLTFSYKNYGNSAYIYQINGKDLMFENQKQGSNEWIKTSVVLDLKAGENEIEFESPNRDSNTISVDYLEIQPLK